MDVKNMVGENEEVAANGHIQNCSEFVTRPVTDTGSNSYGTCRQLYIANQFDAICGPIVKNSDNADMIRNNSEVLADNPGAESVPKTLEKASFVPETSNSHVDGSGEAVTKNSKRSEESDDYEHNSVKKLKLDESNQPLDSTDQCLAQESVLRNSNSTVIDFEYNNVNKVSEKDFVGQVLVLSTSDAVSDINGTDRTEVELLEVVEISGEQNVNSSSGLDSSGDVPEIVSSSEYIPDENSTAILGARDVHFSNTTDTVNLTKDRNLENNLPMMNKSGITSSEVSESVTSIDLPHSQGQGCTTNTDSCRTGNSRDNSDSNLSQDESRSEIDYGNEITKVSSTSNDIIHLKQKDNNDFESNVCSDNSSLPELADIEKINKSNNDRDSEIPEVCDGPGVGSPDIGAIESSPEIDSDRGPEIAEVCDGPDIATSDTGVVESTQEINNDRGPAEVRECPEVGISDTEAVKSTPEIHDVQNISSTIVRSSTNDKTSNEIDLGDDINEDIRSKIGSLVDRIDKQAIEKNDSNVLIRINSKFSVGSESSDKNLDTCVSYGQNKDDLGVSVSFAVETTRLSKNVTGIKISCESISPGKNDSVFTMNRCSVLEAPKVGRISVRRDLKAREDDSLNSNESTQKNSESKHTQVENLSVIRDLKAQGLESNQRESVNESKQQNNESGLAENELGIQENSESIDAIESDPTKQQKDSNQGNIINESTQERTKSVLAHIVDELDIGSEKDSELNQSGIVGVDGTSAEKESDRNESTRVDGINAEKESNRNESTQQNDLSDDLTISLDSPATSEKDVEFVSEERFDSIVSSSVHTPLYSSGSVEVNPVSANRSVGEKLTMKEAPQRVSKKRQVATKSTARVIKSSPVRFTPVESESNESVKRKHTVAFNDLETIEDDHRDMQNSTTDLTNTVAPNSTTQEKVNLISEEIQKIFGEQKPTLTRTQLEELLIQKMCETIHDKSTIGELLNQVTTLQMREASHREKIRGLEKQCLHLKMIMGKYIENVENMKKNNNGNGLSSIVPVKVTRTVGLQVSCVFDRNRKKNAKTKLSKPNQSSTAGPSTSSVTSVAPKELETLLKASNNINTSSSSTVSKTAVSKVQNNVLPPSGTPSRVEEASDVIDLTDTPSKEIAKKSSVDVKPSLNSINSATKMTPNENKTAQSLGSSMVQNRYAEDKKSVNDAAMKPGLSVPKSAVGLKKVPGIANRVHPAPLPNIVSTVRAPPYNKLVPPQPVLRLSKSEEGILLSWNLALNSCTAEVSVYELFSYEENPVVQPSPELWKKIGQVSALPLPMACTLTQFVEGYRYHFAVRAVDVYGRIGQFSTPGSIMLIRTPLSNKT